MDTNVIEKNELAILVEKSGLQTETANILTEKFAPFIEQATEWNSKAKKLVVTDATQLTEMKQAREARLALKDIRIAIANTHKELKADSLTYTQTLDLIKRTLTGMIEPTEAYLQEQEDFAKIAEAKRKAELKTKREELLQPFGVQTDFYKLDEMDEATFQNLYQNSKTGYESRIAEAKKLEEERIAKEQEELKERERIRKENEELKAKQIEQERVMREERMKAEAERKAAEDAANKKLADERAKAEAEQKRMREEAQNKLAAERAEREKAEAELKAKQEAEAKAKAEIEAKAEAELSKGDKQKFQDLINELESVKGKYTFKSKKYKVLFESVVELLNKTINWAISKQ